MELLVALAVSGLVVTAAFRAVSVAEDALVRAREERGVALRGSMARAQLDAWLRGATLLEGGEPFVGTPRPPRDGPPGDELTFAVADGGVLRPGPHRVHLWIGRSPAASAALLAELTPLDAAADRGVDTLLVAPDVLGLRLRYRGRVGRFTGWSAEWASSTRLPDAVELQLVPAEGSVGRSLAPILVAPLVVPLGWGETSPETP